MRTAPKKYAKDLTKQHELNHGAESYFQYIVDSLVNGQRQQVKDLFNAMKKCDQEEFLNDFLKEDGGHDTSTRKICIGELCR
jgi:hypothetical protein